MNLGANIAKYRQKIGLSQEELALKLDVSVETVAVWENGQNEPSIKQLAHLAEILKISIDQLCKADNIPHTEPLFTASIKYTEEIYKKSVEAFSKKHLSILFAGIILCVLILLANIVEEVDRWFLFFPFILGAIFIALIIRLKNGIKKAAEIPLKDNPNAQAEYLFYDDYLVTNTWSDNTTANYTKKYSELSTKVHDERFVYIIFNQRYVAIDKQTCTEHLDKLCQLLDLTPKNLVNTKSYSPTNNSKSLDNNVTQSNNSAKNINGWLTTLFILSLFSIIIALIITAASIGASPIPEFPYAILDHIWKFLLVIPIPATSIILGIIYKSKGYKCKKNILAGIIMVILLLIYGNFPALCEIEVSHDMQYAQDLEQKLNFDIPDDGYISVIYEHNAQYESFAMIKITDDAEKDFITKLKNSTYWKTDTSFIPANAIDAYTIATTSDYDYFTIYNTTTNTYNNFAGKLIYLSYDIETNILSITCYA